MAETLSAADASQQLPALLEKVAQGATIDIVRGGRVMARLVPVPASRALTPDQEAVVRRMRARAAAAAPVGPVRVDRDAAHER